VLITFAEAKAIVSAAKAATWPVGEYETEPLGYEDETHFLVVRGAKQPDPEHPDPNLVIVPVLVPLVDKQTGEIEYVCRTCRRSSSGWTP
jgi:hypothetical protein